MPFETTHESASTVQTPGGLAFQSNMSPFSNFYPVHLEDAQGRAAECAEQLYVLRMAEECGASARIKKGIQEEKNPYVIKELAKGIKNTDQWRRAHKGILAEVVELKFVTYPALWINFNKLEGNISMKQRETQYLDVVSPYTRRTILHVIR